MATLGFDPREDPESYKRKRSGFWHRHYDPATCVETWTCDKRKLNDEMSRAMLDPSFAREFHTQGPRILDKLWGEGTAEAFSYRTKGDQDRVNMRFNPHLGIDPARGRDSMAYYWQDTTTSATTSTSGTTFNTYTNSAREVAMRQELEMQRQRLMNEYIAPKPMKVRKDSIQFTKRLVKNLPFVNGGDGLVETLQREFDHWAKPQMELVRG